MTSPPNEPLAEWPPSDEHAFKLACAALRINPDLDTGRMGLVCMVARLQERILALETRLAEKESAYGPR